MAIWGTKLYLTAFEITDKGKIPLAQNHQVFGFFLAINMLLVTNIRSFSFTAKLYHISFHREIRFLSTGGVITVFRAPFVVHEEREGGSQAAEVTAHSHLCILLSLANPGQWWNSRPSSVFKSGFSFRIGIRQSVPVLPLFPGSPTIRLQIHVTLKQLCCERWCSSCLLGVAEKSVALVFAKRSHLMSFLVSPVKSSVNSSVWSGLFLQTFSSVWPL